MKHYVQQLLLAATTLFFFTCASTTPPIVDEAGVPVETGIARFETVMLGGVEQSILIRTHDPAHPVLLFLHGGPGSPETPVVAHFNKELEKHFVVVNWDQRGAGKSFSKKIPAESFTIEQFIEDFDQQKIFMVGHSWGSALGMYVVEKYPEDFHAYVGTGQLVEVQRNELLTYEFVLEQARQADNGKAIKQLEMIGYPKDGMYKGGLRSVAIQRKWLNKFGGFWYGETSMKPMIQVYSRSPEYTSMDMIKFMKGARRSLILLQDEVMGINLIEQVPEVEIPVYFAIGRHDYIASFVLAKEYFDQLRAPYREFIWFDNSAHSPPFEEPERFNALLIENVLPVNLPDTP
jgi:pimeloyl-ACP methyl ester carboxylesterase